MANYDEANPLVRILPCKGDRGVNTGATVVTSASDMTDTTKAYLYAGTTGGDYTKGHWYYWDGTEWKDGGDYTLAVLESEVDPESANAVQSQAIAAALEALEALIPTIDDTLTVQGAGADAATVGSALDKKLGFVTQITPTNKSNYLLNNMATPGAAGYYFWTSSSGAPDDSPINTAAALLVMGTSLFQLQIVFKAHAASSSETLIDRPIMFRGAYIPNTGTPGVLPSGTKWTKVSSATEINAALAALKKEVDTTKVASDLLQSKLDIFSEGQNIAKNPEDYPFAGYVNPKTGATGGSSNNWFHGFFEAKTGTLLVSASTSTFGSSAPYIPLFDGAGTFVRSVVGTITDGLLTVTLESSDLDGVKYFGHSAKYDGTEHDTIDYNPLVTWDTSVTDWDTPNQRTIKDEYIPQHQDEYFDYALNRIAVEANSNLVTMGDLPLQGYFSDTATGYFVESVNFRSGYIRVEKLGDYYLYRPHSVFGTRTTKVLLFNAEKTTGKVVTGTENSEQEIVKITVDNPAYMVIGYSYGISSSVAPCIVYNTEITSSQVVAGQRTLHPSITLPSSPELMGKTLIFDGDSICYGAKDSQSTLKGWAGRIIAKNAATGHNYAVSGGTIITDTYWNDDPPVDPPRPKHWISESIDNIHSEYPNLDYLILEGGTNDADVIGRFSGDTPPEGFGTWTEDDFSSNYLSALDDTTFCGAVESLFYKAVTYFPNAKIGFIIAMEMGTSTNSIKNRRRYFDEILKLAEKWHIPVLDLWRNSHMDARLEAHYDSESNGPLYYDGQHPTSAGYEVLTPMVEAWMRTL